VIRQAHLIAVVGVFLIGCAVLVMAGCAGVRSEASQKEEQGHTEATKEQAHSDRCEGTRTIVFRYTNVNRSFITNDVPDCPEGGLLSGTDNHDMLYGKDGDDEIHGLGASDYIGGGSGNDIIYGGPGDDSLNGDCYGDGNGRLLCQHKWQDQVGGEGDDVIYGGGDVLMGSVGEDVLYGGDDNDLVIATNVGASEVGVSEDGQRDKLYCGPGKDHYLAGKLDYVDSSCEKKQKVFGGGGIA
jgi:Ca2+-binding RTX toxin-like protein